MNLISKHTGGTNLVCRPQARRPWYPTERSRPAQAEVWWRYEGEPPAAARIMGRFKPGQQVIYPLNPLVDRNLILSTIAISSEGLRSVREIDDPIETPLTYQREITVPTVGQVDASTHTNIRLAIDNYSTLAIKRRVRYADDEAMTINENVLNSEVNPGQTLPRLIDLVRDDGGTGTRSIWVRISHSSGGDYTGESIAQEFIYADNVGAGGGSGTEDPFPHREYELP